MLRNKTIWLLYLALLPVFLNHRAAAQVVQGDRLELLMATNENPFTLVALQEYGAMLIREISDYSQFRVRNWEVLKFDTALNENWKISFSEAMDLNLIGYERKGPYSFLLFRKGVDVDGSFILKRINLRNGQAVNTEIRNILAMDLKYFEIIGENVVFGGSYNGRPAIVLHSMSSDMAKILPDVFKDNAELVDIAVDDINNIFSVVTSERSGDRRHTLFIKTFDEDGSLISNVEIENDENHALLDGRVTHFDNDGQRIAGTYSRRKSFAAQGFFIAHIDINGKQNIEYFALGELRNFFSYLPENRRNKLQRRYTPKGDNSRSKVVNYRFLISDLKKTEQGHILLAEAYMPQFNHVPRGINAFTVPTPGLNQFNSVLTGYRFLFSVMMAFDHKGKLLWDQALEINDIEPNSLEPLVQLSYDGKRAVLMYGGQDEIRSAVFEADKVVQAKKVDKIALKYENDRVRTSNYLHSGLDYWYGKYFIAYGVQNIRNTARDDLGNYRKVFYINKIHYN